jgi:hypothetical protein
VSPSAIFFGVILTRLSQHSKTRRKGRCDKFRPDIKQWQRICAIASVQAQIARYFSISQETLYKFLDEERYKEEQDENYKSSYLEILKEEKKKTKELVASKFFESIKNGDNASVIFGMKVYNHAIEAKDVEALILKKREVELKEKTYLTSLAEKFNLNVEELQKFTDKHFSDKNLNDI